MSVSAKGRIDFILLMACSAWDCLCPPHLRNFLMLSYCALCTGRRGRQTGAVNWTVALTLAFETVFSTHEKVSFV